MFVCSTLWKHRDIKLENICFESMADDAEVKLVDFGLSASFKVRNYVEKVLNLIEVCIGQITLNQAR